MLIALATLSVAGVLLWRSKNTFPADQIGYVTAKQLQAAARGELTAAQLTPQQRQGLPKTPDSTLVEFFKKPDGTYGLLLLSTSPEPYSEESR